MTDIEVMQVLGKIADDCFFRGNCDECKFDKEGQCILKGRPSDWNIEKINGEGGGSGRMTFEVIAWLKGK